MPNVATVGCNHTCPETVPAPHLEGPILPPGHPNAQTNTRAWACILDRAECQAGEPDVIVQGSSNVLHEGLPVSRVGDLTLHGGVIVEGEGAEIGGAAVTFLASGSEEFLKALQQALAEILPTDTGQLWLSRMAAIGLPVCFAPTGDDNGYTYVQDGFIVIEWNPDFENADAGAEIVLAHEMVHALHIAEGTFNDDIVIEETDSNGETTARLLPEEERATTGTSSDGAWYDNGSACIPLYTDYSDDPLTENAFRDDLDYPNRDTYLGPPEEDGPSPYGEW